MKKLGIIGYGALGRFYAHMIAKDHRVEGLTIGAICDIDPERLQLAKSQFPDIPTFSSIEALLAAKPCDFVSIAVPHFLHPNLTRLALEAGMPAIVEKPAGIIPRSVREMNTCALKHPETQFGIMLNQRTNPIFRRIRSLTQSGDMGQLRQVLWVNRQFRTQHYYDSSSWRATWGGEGGGVLVNQAPHQIDLLQWMFGMPKCVYATTNTGFRRNIAVENDVFAQFSYENGATGVFITCTHDILGEDRLTAVFDRGRVRVLEGRQLEIETLIDSEDRLGTEYTDESLAELRRTGQLYTTETFDKQPDPYSNSEHVEVFRAFTARLMDGSTPLVARGEDGLQGVILASAMQLSGWLKKPIELPFDDDLYLRELNRRIAKEGKYTLQESIS